MQPEVKVENQNVEVTQPQPQQQNTQPQNIPQQEEQKQNDKEINWNKFKEARQREREQLEAETKARARAEQEAAALKAALEAAVNRPTAYQEQDHTEETEDQRIDKKVQAALQKQQREFEDKQREREIQEYPQRILRDHPDFNQVCHADNLDYLEYHYPEVSSAFKHMPQGYDKWSAIYKAVKRFVPNTDTKKDLMKAERNLNKPQSTSSTGVTQNTSPSPLKLDKDRKEQNWQRMQRIIKGLKE